MFFCFSKFLLLACIVLKFSQKIPFKKVGNLSGRDKPYSFFLRRLPWMVPVTQFTWMNRPGVVLKGI